MLQGRIYLRWHKHKRNYIYILLADKAKKLFYDYWQIPRLFYVDQKKMEYKGECVISPAMKVEIKNTIVWQIVLVCYYHNNQNI